MSTIVMRSLRINYHATDKTHLFQSLVLPLVREAQGRSGVISAWPQSHWRFGPHLSIYLHGEDTSVTEVLKDAAARAKAYLKEHRSTQPVSSQGWEQTSRELGRLELVEPPYTPVHPDNTVEVVDGRPTDTFLRTHRAVEAKGATLGAGLDCLLDSDGTLLRGSAATEAAFRGMAALAASYPTWGLISGYQAFLSHWKEYFYWVDEGDRLSGPLRHAWQQQQGHLCAIVELAHRRTPGEPTGDPVLDRWFRWVDAELPTAGALAATGDVLPYPHPSRAQRAERFGEQTGVQWSGSDDRDYSDFHTAFRQLDFGRLGNGTDFAAYRFVINSFFELLPCMGITPLQRYSLAFLFTEAAQDVVGETWDVTIAKAVERQRTADPQTQPTLPWRGSHV